MKRVTRWHILFIGIVFLSIGGLAIWWGFCFQNTILDKILTVLVTVLLLFVSSVFFILFASSLGKKHNVFLYDKETKVEISVEDLTFEKICEFLDLYMGIVFYNKKNISFSDFSDVKFLASIPKEYHCLILIRLLLVWMEFCTDEHWKQFAETDKRNIDAIVDILSNCGERVISSKLLYFWASYTGNDIEIKEYFLSYIEYLREFMLS
jgi:hypothetical protein